MMIVIDLANQLYFCFITIIAGVAIVGLIVSLTIGRILTRPKLAIDFFRLFL